MATFDSQATIDLAIEFNKKSVDINIAISQIAGVTPSKDAAEGTNTAITLKDPVLIVEGWAPRDVLYTKASIAEVKEIRLTALLEEKEQNIELLRKHGIRLIG